MQHPVIAQQLARHQCLRGQVQREFPDVDEETLNDTLAGMTDLPEMIAAILRSALQDLALAKGLRGRVVEMQERLARLEDGAQKKRQLITSVMERRRSESSSSPTSPSPFAARPQRCASCMKRRYPPTSGGRSRQSSTGRRSRRR